MRRLILLGLTIILSGCAATMNTGSHCVVESDYLAGTIEYTWYNTPTTDLRDQTGYISPAIVTMLERRVEVELAGKGFERVVTPSSTTTTGMQVAITLRARRELVAHTAQTICSQPDCRNMGNYSTATEADMRTIGFLAADVYYNGKPIWRGWVERNLYPSERDNAQSVVEEAVPVLFESFPP
jgi:hypothetical protein